MERNISRAAVQVGVSQSAMSKTLGRLRTLFGDDLLVRAGQEYHLSPFAEEILPELREALLTLERTLTRRPQFDPRVDEHVFRISAIDALEYLLLKPLIDLVTASVPGVSLEILDVAGEETLDKIRSGEIDLALTAVEYPKNDLSQQDLFPDRRVCAVWAGLPGIGDTLTMEQLLSLPHAAYDWAGWDRHGGEYPEWSWMGQLPVRVTDVRLLMRLFMLRGTNLVTFTWEAMARSVAEMADIRVVEPPFSTPTTRHRMLWHPRNTSDPANQWLRDRLIEIAKPLDTPVTAPERPANETPVAAGRGYRGESHQTG
jgi:DNA-binding transcriptional LysR family regulator